MKLCLITSPYNVQGKGRGGGGGPQALLRAGLVGRLEAQGHTVSGPRAVELTPDEEAAYGGWWRVGTANGRLADAVAGARREGAFVLGLLADCNGLLGMLGGLGRGDDPFWPRRAGLVWIDAHGDYNTPETTRSGMLGGMPVAVACGKCLVRLRERSGMCLPLQPPDVLMVGLRDLDPEEAASLRRDGLTQLTAQDLVGGSDRLREAMGRLSAREDLIYVHVDLDILDPGLAPAAGLPSTGGISGRELGDGLGRLLAYPRVQALGFVSYDPARDADGRTLEQVVEALLTATAGASRAPGGFASWEGRHAT